MGTQTAHLSPILGGSKDPHWGLALAGLLIPGPNCQVLVVLQGHPGRKRWSRVRAGAGFALTSVASTSQDILLLLWTTATSRKETGLTKWKLSSKTYKHPTGTHLTSHYQGPSVQKIQSLAATENLSDKLELSQTFKYRGPGSLGQPCPPPLTSISWVRRKNSAKGVNVSLEF